MSSRLWAGLLLAATLLLGVGGCSETRREVVVYTSLDPVFSESLLERFEKRSGIDVRIVTDTEATKTTGLVERVRREKDRPRCDVFWNNEVLRTIRMAREGLFDRGMRDNPLHHAAFGPRPERREAALRRLFEAVLSQYETKGAVLGAFSSGTRSPVS